MHWLEPDRGDIEFPGRYILDEKRFPGRQETMRGKMKEENSHEPASHLS